MSVVAAKGIEYVLAIDARARPRLTPTTSTQPKTAQLPRDVEEHVREALEACERGELIELTPEEIEQSCQTAEAL